jgi:hypothetical protein
MTTVVAPPEKVAEPFDMGQCLAFAVAEVERGKECRARHQSLADWATQP